MSVEPRDGQVWSCDAHGAAAIESVRDFWIVAELATVAGCPAGPVDWGGVPVRFVALAQ
jgi:hypothetical protein